ncbi:MAG: hypothetical protein ACKVOU_14400 [Cytophagales bacterium]
MNAINLEPNVLNVDPTITLQAKNHLFVQKKMINARDHLEKIKNLEEVLGKIVKD